MTYFFKVKKTSQLEEWRDPEQDYYYHKYLGPEREESSSDESESDKERVEEMDVDSETEPLDKSKYVEFRGQKLPRRAPSTRKRRLSAKALENAGLAKKRRIES